MFRLHSFLLLLVAAGTLLHSVRAEVETAVASPRSTVTQVVGLTEFTIDYSRPGVKGRKIFGGLVPYGERWRTGANATTKLSADRAFTFEGETIPAGEYVLFTVPGKERWTILVYGDTEVPNVAAFDRDEVVARFQVEPEELSDPVESFHIWFDHLRDASAKLLLDWSNVRVPIEVGVNTVAQSRESIREAMRDPEDLGPGDFANAAEFYYEHDLNLEQAAEWMRRAVEANENAFWWRHTYAKILAGQGKTEAALEEAKASLEKARAASSGDSGYIQRNVDLIDSLQ